jgi:hypothetical protein
MEIKKEADRMIMELKDKMDKYIEPILRTETIGNPDQYTSLRRILGMALDQAQNGKGLERHANGLPFDKQLICVATREEGHGFPRGQIRKKIEEIKRLPDLEAQIREALSIIVYAAADIIVMEEELETKERYDETQEKSN